MSSKNERKKGLGRGLSSFLEGNTLEDLIVPDNDSSKKISNTGTHVPIDLIDANLNQPRKNFSKDDLEELANSIRETGIIQPIVVRKKGERFEIVAGERRWRSAQIANIHEVPVVVKELTDEEVVKIAIIENVQRVDLNPVEEASSFNQLISDYKYTQEKISNVLGKSRSYIANSLRLLSLPEKVLSLLREGKLTSGHGRALIGYEEAVSLAFRAVKENLSVRQIESLVKIATKIGEKPINKSAIREKDFDTINLEQDLKMVLDMKTEIFHEKDNENGKIVIYYKNLLELDSFCSKIMKAQ